MDAQCNGRHTTTSITRIQPMGFPTSGGFPKEEFQVNFNGQGRRSEFKVTR